jgi:hypothetical protein
MKEDEDLELLALQRQLDDAFETTRPRRGFEDELWLRMQTRRPFWGRLADGWAGLTGAVRELPMVPTAAVASVLVVLIAAGALTWGALSGGHGAGSTATSLNSSAGGKYDAGPAAAPARGGFGPVPAPSLTGPGPSPMDVGAPDEAATPKAATPPANLYFGPASLTWSGKLDVRITQAPVFRYDEPNDSFANAFATQHQLSPQSGPAQSGYLGTYAGPAFTISLRGSVRTPPSQPFYVLTPSPSASTPAGANPTDVAASYLRLMNLLPVWPYTVSVDSVGDQARVRFLEAFPVPDVAATFLIDGSGERYGIEVDVSGGRPVRVVGPLPVGLDSAGYPIISAAQAVSSALASGAAGPVSITPAPAVKLTSAELVYALVWAGDHSFYEPCFLFSGAFDYNGTKYVKRILVPAVDPSYRSP